MSGLEQTLQRLERLHAETRAQQIELVTAAEAEGLSHLSEAATIEFRRHTDLIADLDERIADLREEVKRSGRGDADSMDVRKATAAITGGGTGTERWARRCAAAFLERAGDGIAGEQRALFTGSVDVPTLVELSVAPMARPVRLLDLLVERKPLSSNAFEYFKQTVRTNNAAPVPDNTTKPTSVFTTVPVQDRARVVAHLSEPAPVRLWQDAEAIPAWLNDEMVQGVLDGLEHQIIQGNGEGENFLGLINQTGVTSVAYDTDPITSLRHARTVMQLAGEKPTAIVLNPGDAETVDLARWGSSGGLLLDGFTDGNTRSANIFGGADITRVTSPSVPAGTAVLGDWSKLRLYVREAVNVMLDLSGPLFQANQFQMRAEGRFGLGWLRPSAFALVALTS